MDEEGITDMLLGERNFLSSTHRHAQIPGDQQLQETVNKDKSLFSDVGGFLDWISFAITQRIHSITPIFLRFPPQRVPETTNRRRT